MINTSTDDNKKNPLLYVLDLNKTEVLFFTFKQVGQ